MTVGMVLWSLTLFVGTALAEILGYLTYAWLRQGRSAWLLASLAGMAIIVLGHARGG
jgi:drug/metabolite transporter superfamily protein YnfA